MRSPHGPVPMLASGSTTTTCGSCPECCAPCCPRRVSAFFITRLSLAPTSSPYCLGESRSCPACLDCDLVGFHILALPGELRGLRLQPERGYAHCERPCSGSIPGQGRGAGDLGGHDSARSPDAGPGAAGLVSGRNRRRCAGSHRRLARARGAVQAIRAEIRDRRLILSIERLDYIKGPVEKLLAYERLLETRLNTARKSSWSTS